MDPLQKTQNSTEKFHMSKIFSATLLAALLAGCSSDSMEPSSEEFSSAADVHNDPSIIEGTESFEALMEEQNADGVWSSSVFETETVLLERSQEAESSVWDAVETNISPAERQAFYGDLHVHTEYSFDAYAMGTQATPYDAYRFARGEAILNPGGFKMQLTEPLDFYAVTDHAMFLGLAKASGDTSTEFSKNAFSEPYNGLNDPGKLRHRCLQHRQAPRYFFFLLAPGGWWFASGYDR